MLLIASNLFEQYELRSLALSSRRNYAVANTYIFRHVTIRSIPSFISFLRDIDIDGRGGRQRGKSVLSLRVIFPRDRCGNGLSTALVRDITRTLDQCPNIALLCLPHFSRPISSRILPQVGSSCIRCLAVDAGNPYTYRFLAWLARQDEVRQIIFPRPHRDIFQGEMSDLSVPAPTMKKLVWCQGAFDSWMRHLFLRCQSGITHLRIVELDHHAESTPALFPGHHPIEYRTVRTLYVCFAKRYIPDRMAPDSGRRNHQFQQQLGDRSYPLTTNLSRYQAMVNILAGYVDTFPCVLKLSVESRNDGKNVVYVSVINHFPVQCKIAQSRNFIVQSRPVGTSHAHRTEPFGEYIYWLLLACPNVRHLHIDHVSEPVRFLESWLDVWTDIAPDLQHVSVAITPRGFPTVFRTRVSSHEKTTTADTYYRWVSGGRLRSLDEARFDAGRDDYPLTLLRRWEEISRREFGDSVWLGRATRSKPGVEYVGTDEKTLDILD